MKTKYLLLFLLMAIAARAEVKDINVTIFGMD